MGIFRKRIQTDLDLNALTTRELDLVKSKQNKIVQITEAETAAGEALLDGAAPGSIQAIVTLQAELTVIDRAIAACRSMRSAVILGGSRRESERLKATAAELQRTLDGHMARLGKLLQQVADAEGVAYAAAEPGARSQAMSLEIERLTARATEFAERQIPMSGVLDIEDALDDERIVRFALEHPSEGPAAEDILDWLRQCRANAAARNKPLRDQHARVYITWTGGKIDATESYIFARELASAAIGSGTGLATSGLELASGTFRPTAAEGRVDVGVR